MILFGVGTAVLRNGRRQHASTRVLLRARIPRGRWTRPTLIIRLVATSLESCMLGGMYSRMYTSCGQFGLFSWCACTLGTLLVALLFCTESVYPHESAEQTAVVTSAQLQRS